MSIITPQDALQRITAQSAMRKAKGKPIEFIRTTGFYGNVFLFQRGDEGIVAPADDSLDPVIADFPKGNVNEMPEVCEQWIQSYDDEINYLQEPDYLIEENGESLLLPINPIKPHNSPNNQSTDSPNRQTIPNLVKATWSQDSPYNDRLSFPGLSQKCLVGCIAVTIGQIMHYWGTRGYHRGCTKTTQYKWSDNGITVEALPPITCFDYKHLTSGKPKTAEEILAVSTLLEYIGKAVQLKYSPTGTGGKMSIYLKMMRERLRLGKNLRSINADSMGIKAFEEAIYQELAQGQPVAMRGVAEVGGHSFVCSGYNADSDMFWFNWGWGGKCNGYYKMTALNPKAKHSFNSNKAAVIGIKPEYILGDANNDGEISVNDVMTINDNILNGKYDEKSDINADGTVSLADTMLVIDQILGKQNI